MPACDAQLTGFGKRVFFFLRTHSEWLMLKGLWVGCSLLAAVEKGGCIGSLGFTRFDIIHLAYGLK